MTTAKRGGRKADPVTAILAEIKALVKDRQGEPLPLRGGLNSESGRLHYVEQEGRWSAINAARSVAGTLGKDGLILEDAFAALGEVDDADVRRALVLLAAEAISAVEDIDRRSE